MRRIAEKRGNSKSTSAGVNEELLGRLRLLTKIGPQQIPEEHSGNGAAGDFLEFLMGVNGGNRPAPDTGLVELKFSTGGTVTLFSLKPKFLGGIFAA